jgi:hypothetical protein
MISESYNHNFMIKPKNSLLILEDSFIIRRYARHDNNDEIKNKKFYVRVKNKKFKEQHSKI